MRIPKKHLLLAIALGAVVFVATPSLWVYHYIEHDPRFCTSCHLMDTAYTRWKTSEHSKIECHSCHIADVQSNLLQLYYTVLEPKAKVEKHAEIDRSVCLKCHEKGGARWQQILTTAGHDIHVTKRNLQCLDCHSESVHRFAPPVRICMKCHEKVQMYETKMEHLQCLQCHDYLADSPGAELRPDKETCRSCHGDKPAAELAGKVHPPADAKDAQGQQAEAAKKGSPKHDELPPPDEKIGLGEGIALAAGQVGAATVIPVASVHGDMDCKKCHNPHRADKEEMRSGIVCKRCHEGEPFESTAKGPKEHQCRNCHQPHDAHGATTEACKRCHSTYAGPMTEKHDNQCGTCHRPHVMKANGQDCKSCHRDQAQQLFTAAPPQHDRCETCHEPHAPPMKLQSCAVCHGQMASQVATARRPEHQKCVSCHEPHGAKPTADGPCRNCHVQESTKILHAGVREHERCRSCHKTSHGEPETDRAACANCHVDQAKLTTMAKTPKEHTNCATCHSPHDEKAHAGVEKCATCHEKKLPPPEKRSHEGKCITCHAQHGAPQVTTAKCQDCHKDVKLHPGKAVEKHGTCISCHSPHEGKTKEEAKALAQASCQKCHDKQVKSVTVWVDRKEHQTCNNCHVGHDAGNPKACATCHEQMAKENAGTKHEKCVMCHQPHESKQIGKAAWWAGCVRCHQKNAEAVRERKGPTHTSCASCHVQHAFPRPTCKTCHDAIGQQLMHQVKEHTDCRLCHDTHGKNPPEREACVKCHTKQSVNHFPESPRCTSCHPFGMGATEKTITPKP